MAIRPDIVDLRIGKEFDLYLGEWFAVIYLVSQMLVHHPMSGLPGWDRGSAGSSFVATMIRSPS